MKKTISIISILLLLLSGCSTRGKHFTTLIDNPKETDYNNLEEHYTLIKRKGRASMKRHFLMYLPISGYNSFTDEVVIDKLLRRYNGDVATNVTIKDKFMFFFYYNQYAVEATGDIWRKK